MRVGLRQRQAHRAGPRRHRKSAALRAGTCEFWISTSTIRPWQNRSWSRTPCSTWRECCRTRVHRDLLKELLDQWLERAGRRFGSNCHRSIVCSERNQISNQTELRGDWTFRCEASERTPSFPANISRLSQLSASRLNAPTLFIPTLGRIVFP